MAPRLGWQLYQSTGAWPRWGRRTILCQHHHQLANHLGPEKFSALKTRKIAEEFPLHWSFAWDTQTSRFLDLSLCIHIYMTCIYIYIIYIYVCVCVWVCVWLRIYIICKIKYNIYIYIYYNLSFSPISKDSDTSLWAQPTSPSPFPGPKRRSTRGISPRRSPLWPPCLVARNAAPTCRNTGHHNVHRKKVDEDQTNTETQNDSNNVFKIVITIICICIHVYIYMCVCTYN